MNLDSMKISNYFRLINPQYTYLKITPDKSIRNYNSANIAKAISHTWKNLNKRIKKEKKRIFFETNFKISYIIDVQNNNANFYFLIPKPFLTILLEKIREIWPKATIDEVESIEPFTNDSITYQLVCKKEDALSIQIDKKSNEPLNSILNVIEIMKDDDRVTIIYNFMPRTQFGWLKQYQDTIDKIKAYKPIEKEKSNFAYIGKSLLTYLVELFDSIVEVFLDFTGDKKEKGTSISLVESLATALEQNKELSNSTKRKKELRIIDTQIAVVSHSKDETRKDNNALAVCQAYRVLDEDNELIYNKAKKMPLIEDYKFKGIDINTVSTDECQNFIQVPGRSLLRQFNIKHIEVNENPVPRELQQGYIELGNVKCKGNVQMSYLEDEYNVGSLPLVINGAQGSGKSTFIANMYRFANRRKEGGVLIDYIKKNELTEEVLKYLPKEDIVLLDYSKPECIQGFAFNELSYTIANLSTYDKLKFANLQAQQVLELVNAVNEDNQSLAARMRKYLIASATVVFSTGQSSLKEVVKCLEEWEIRHSYINMLNKEEKKLLEDKIKILQELDEWSKVTKDNPVPEVIGTKESRIDGILDRISLLKEDFSLEFMFNKGSENNINLAEELEKGKTIIIKMLQDEFSPHAKNVITTFFISKIWMAIELRGRWNNKPKRAYVTVDEIFQTPTAMKMLAKKNILPQTRKFGMKFCTTSQIISQLDILLDTLEGAGASFMLLKGSKEEDFKKFASKLEGYEYEDLRDMEQHSSLNLIYYSGGYASFISKLPVPV